MAAPERHVYVNPSAKSDRPVNQEVWSPALDNLTGVMDSLCDRQHSKRQHPASFMWATAFEERPSSIAQQHHTVVPRCTASRRGAVNVVTCRAALTWRQSRAQRRPYMTQEGTTSHTPLANINYMI